MSTGRESSVVTFLFTDIVGSTQLTDTLGDEGAQEIVRLHNALVRAEVARHGGSEVKAMGDGFMIAFRSVTAALSCAAAIQRAIAQHNDEQPARQFMVRMGLNAGEAISEEEDYFGAAVIAAARISALAGGGEILTSEAVKQLAQGMRGMDYAFKGEFPLKGLRQSFRIYQVLSAGAPSEVLSLRRARFVGRERELGTVQEAMEHVAAGSGLFLLITGEAGIGKTRLAEEAARDARTKGFRVWRGRCQGTEGSPPYLAFIEILRQYVEERPDDVLMDELGDDAAQIGRLVPEVARRIPVREEHVPLPPEQERYRLLEAVRRLVELLARRRPVLLLLEDLHWADAATFLLLRHLAQTVAGARILVLGTAREEDLSASHPISEAVAEFSRLQLYRRLSLSGLNVAALQEILASLSPGEAPPELAEAIYRQTEGNPFFVTELISHLHSEGALFGEDRGWRKDFSGTAWDVPDSVRVVIERRLNTLDEQTRKTLTAASVMGRDFSYHVMEALEEVPADVLLDSLDEGVRVGMIEQAERSAAHFRFAHHLIRQTLYDGLPSLRRQRYHLRIGEAMEWLADGEPEELAYHFGRAETMSPPDKTRGYLTLAGEKARNMAAWQEAAGYFGRALELAGELEAGQRAQLLHRLGEAEGGGGNWEGAVAHLGEAMALYRSLGETDTAGWIAYSLRRLYGARGQFKEAAEVVEGALAALGEADSQVRSRLLAQAGFIRSAFGETGEAERLLDESMAIAERLEEPGAKGFSAFITGMHCLSYTRLHEAADWLKRAVEWATAGDDPWTASQASSFRRHILFTLGRLAEAEEGMDEEERLASKAGNFLAVCVTKWIGGGLACLHGDLEQAESMFRELLDLIEAAQAHSGMPGALINLAYVRFLRGDADGFEDSLAQAVAAYERMSAAPIDDPRPVLVLLRALSGRESEARALLEAERYLNFEDHWTTGLAEARATLAAALAALGEREAADKLYAPLRDWTVSAGYVLTGASSIPQLVDRLLGMAAAAAGAAADADRHFEAALGRAQEMGARTELAECLYWYARHLLASAGTRERGLAYLDRAADCWQELGMTAQLPRVQAARSAFARE